MLPKSLSDWLSYIESQHPNNIELGLDRCSLVLSKLNYTRPKDKIFTIAGTNGKGSTCALLTQYLVQSNLQVGTFTSPHFVHFNERIAINGKPVDDEVICQAFEYIERVRGDTQLTYFEFNTLAALHIFSNAKLDYWVLEVGLGGRLDSVNMIDTDVAVVTSISLDHIDWLGDSLDGIAKEKAGIGRANKLFISGVNQAPETLKATALEIGSIFKQKGQDFSFTIDSEHTWSWQVDELNLSGLPLPSLPVENAATCLAILYYSGFTLDSEVLRQLFSQVELTGRFQTIMRSPEVVLDVAHNPEAALALSKRLQKMDKPVVAVCGMLHDKDINAVLTCLHDDISRWFLTDLPASRGAKAAELQAVITKQATIFDSVANAFDAAIAHAKEQEVFVVVFGSFITVADALMHHKTHYQKTI